MKKAQNTLILLFCSLLLGAGCQSNVKQYQGRIIEIDFNNVENIEPGSWMKVDDWKFTHVRTMKEGNETDLPLPTDYIIVDSLENRGRPYGTSLNPKNIGLHIGRNLKEINNNRLPANDSRYIIPDPALLTAIGVLKLAKADSSYITITVPKNYPIPIRVLEK